MIVLLNWSVGGKRCSTKISIKISKLSHTGSSNQAWSEWIAWLLVIESVEFLILFCDNYLIAPWANLINQSSLSEKCLHVIIDCTWLTKSLCVCGPRFRLFLLLKLVQTVLLHIEGCICVFAVLLLQQYCIPIVYHCAIHAVDTTLCEGSRLQLRTSIRVIHFICQMRC